MKLAIYLAIKIILFGFVLPYKIWNLSKQKLLNNSRRKSIDSLLDNDYIVTSWLDLMIDSVIFIIYPLGLIALIIGAIFTDIKVILGIIPLYFISLIISFSREIGGSFMLLYINIKKIRQLIEDGNNSL